MAGARYTTIWVLVAALLLAGCGKEPAPAARSADFIVVPVSHAMIMQNSEVFEQVRNYLAHGSFKRR